MRIVHLSDPHLTTPPSWRTLAGRSHFGKRYLGYASWHRKRRLKMRRPWLDEVTAEVVSLEPDQLLISGDLTQIGTEEELCEARAWLEQLAPPDRICFVPGNHDAYAAESWRLLQRELGAYLPGQGGSGFPVIRRIGSVAVLGLSSAVPTPPLSASGLLGEAQLGRLAAGLAEHHDALKVLLLHHPPLPGMISYRKRLRDAGALARLLAVRPVDLILHGHQHRDEDSERQGIKVYCTAPASSRSASFRVFDVTQVDAGWEIATAHRQRTGAGFSTAKASSWLVSAPGARHTEPATG